MNPRMSRPHTEQADRDAPAQPAGRSRAALLRFVIIAATILIADIAIKRYVFADMLGRPLTPADVSSFDETEHGPVVLVPDLLNLKLTLNRGAVFGLGQGGRWLFIAISIIAVALISYVFARSSARAKWLHIALALVLGGALGNMYDRFVFSAVRDMFWMFPDVKLPFGLRWPGGSDELYPWIYNLADVALCGGIVLLFIVMYFSPGHKRRTETSHDHNAT